MTKFEWTQSVKTLRRPYKASQLHLHGLPKALERIRQAADRDKKMRFTSLWHHVYNIEALGKVKMVIYANHGLRAAIKGMETIFAKIKGDGGIDDLDELIDPVSHIFGIQGVPEMKENEKKFLR